MVIQIHPRRNHPVPISSNLSKRLCLNRTNPNLATHETHSLSRRCYLIGSVVLFPRRAATVVGPTCSQSPHRWLWVMGQFLEDDSKSLPLVMPADLGWGNYKFKRAIRTWSYTNPVNKPKERFSEQFAFVPLTATRNGVRSTAS